MKKNINQTQIQLKLSINYLFCRSFLKLLTAAVRHLASSGVDVNTIMAGGASALYGINHGGARGGDLNVEKIKKINNIPYLFQMLKIKK